MSEVFCISLKTIWLDCTPIKTRQNSKQKVHSTQCTTYLIGHRTFCQTLGLILRLRVDFVLPLSQEQEQEEEEEEEQEPLNKIYQKGVY